jgi:hypothetical protein
MFYVPLEHLAARARERPDEGETMGTTDKLHVYLGELDPPMMIWEARGEGYVPEEIRREGQAALGVLSAIADEVETIRRRLTVQLTAAGHVPLAGTSGNGRMGPPFPAATGPDAHAIRPASTRSAGH